jgi:hypothetical protein
VTARVSILLVLVYLSACSSEQLRRTSYETLKAAERQRCMNEAFSDCPRQSGYDDFQLKRDEILSPADSH